LTVTRAAPATTVTEILRSDRIGAILVLTLNRPAARNSLSLAMVAALTEALAATAADRSVRAVILAAEGAVFCAGHDLKELTERRADADGGRAFFEAAFRRCADMMQMILALPQPVIACVKGTATAAGCQLVASCDLAVASSAASFATPGVNIGLFCSSPMVALSRNVARKHAFEMLLTGDMISAADALRIGLVNRVVAPGEEAAEALALARRIAAKSASAIATGKRAFYAQLEMALTTAYDHTCEVMVENMLKGEAKEGISAFLAKRPPKWGDQC
jgi:enoyl-CoA hydratase/carnithine racemase